MVNNIPAFKVACGFAEEKLFTGFGFNELPGYLLLFLCSKAPLVPAEINQDHKGSSTKYSTSKENIIEL